VNIRVLDDVHAEVDGAAAYYESQSPGLGDQFLDSLAAAIERLTVFPGANRMRPADARIQHFHRFPYGLVYQLFQDEIVIIAVMHLHREPDYWHDRLE